MLPVAFHPSTSMVLDMIITCAAMPEKVLLEVQLLTAPDVGIERINARSELAY